MTVLAGDGAGVIRWWQTSTGKELGVVAEHTSAVASLAPAADGKTLVSGSFDHTVRVWQLDTGKAVHPCPGHQGPVASVAFSPDGKTVISAGWDKTIRLWDVASGKEIRRLIDPAPIRFVAVAPDGKTVISNNWSHSKNVYLTIRSICRLWDLETGKEVRQFPELNGVSEAPTRVVRGR